MYKLKRRGAKTDSCGTPFFKRRSLRGLLSPVVRGGEDKHLHVVPPVSS